MKRLSVMIIVIGLLFGCIPLTASASATALPSEVTLQFTVGSPNVTINGVASKIQKPVQVNGTTLVPLKVLTKAFGAKLTANSKVLNVSYDSAVVGLTIGSKTMTINGTASTLPAAPVVTNGTTMVPVGIVAQAFHASVEVFGSKIIVTGWMNSGYAKIGDSLYGWSMNYPVGLWLHSTSRNSYDGIWDNWYNSDLQFSLGVHIMDASLFEDDTNLLNDSTEQIILKGTTSNQGKSVRRLITRDSEGSYYEYRAVRNGGHEYIVSVGGQFIQKRSELDVYKQQLDSFTTTFNMQDKSIYDINWINTRLSPFEDLDNGLKLSLPGDWESSSSEPAYSTFYGMDGTLDFNIFAKEDEETAEEWRTRSREQLEKYTNASYIKNISEYTVKFGNGMGQVLQYDTTKDKKTWETNYEMYYIAGNYKYKLIFTFSQPDGATIGKRMFDTIIGTVHIDTNSVDERIKSSEVFEEGYKSEAHMVSSNRGYQIEIPGTWTNFGEMVLEEKDISLRQIYPSHGGAFDVIVEKWEASGSTQDAINRFMEKHDITSDSIVSSSEMKIQGVSVINIESNTNSFVWDYYFAEHNGYLYTFFIPFDEQSDTPAFRAEIDHVMQSLKFTS